MSEDLYWPTFVVTIACDLCTHTEINPDHFHSTWCCVDALHKDTVGTSAEVSSHRATRSKSHTHTHARTHARTHTHMQTHTHSWLCTWNLNKMIMMFMPIIAQV